MLLAILFLLTSIFSSCGTSQPEKFQTIKLLIHDKKYIFLDAGDYQVWLFYKWESKHIDISAADLPSITIFAPDRKVVTQELVTKGVERVFLSGKDRARRGLMISLISIKSG